MPGKKEVGKEEGKVVGRSPEGEHVLGPLSSGFYPFLEGENLRGGLRGGF